MRRRRDEDRELIGIALPLCARANLFKAFMVTQMVAIETALTASSTRSACVHTHTHVNQSNRGGDITSKVLRITRRCTEGGAHTVGALIVNAVEGQKAHRHGLTGSVQCCQKHFVIH